MQRSVILPVHFFLGLFAILGLVTAVPADADSEHRKSMTGTWKTRTPSPFIIQRGATGPTPQITEMTWRLTEDEHGLIHGVNSYMSTDGETMTEGDLCMVGARDRSRVVLSEGDPGDPETPSVAIFVFDCERRGRNQLRCLGSGLSTLEPIALHAVLVRSKHSFGSGESDEHPGPDFCFPTE